MRQSISFDNHASIQSFLTQYQEDFEKNKQNYPFANNWKIALLADLVIDSEDYKTYLDSEGSEYIEIANIGEELDEKAFLEAFLLAKGNSVRTRDLTPNFALTKALWGYDDYRRSQAQDQSLNHFRSDPAIEVDNGLPMFIHSGSYPLTRGATVGLAALQKNQNNELFNLLREPSEAFQRLRVKELITSLMSPYRVYYTDKSKPLDETKKSLNDEFLAFLLITSYRDRYSQDQSYKQLKESQADHKLSKKVHLSEITATMVTFLAMYKICSLYELTGMPWMSYVIAALAAKILYSGLDLNTVRPREIFPQVLTLLVFAGSNMIVDSISLYKENPNSMSELCLASVVRAIPLWGTYSGTQLILENFYRIRYAEKQGEAIATRLSRMESQVSEERDSEATPTMKP